MTTQRILRNVLIGVLIISCCKELVEVSQRMYVETQTTIQGDAMTYMAAGRGLLNGLIPYQDLFETKPPGMFFIAALSIATTGGEQLAWILQLVIFAATPLLIVALASRETR